MISAATLDPEARYLDHERVIRELEQAERDHELDAAGVIERLKDAVNTCHAAADRYTAKANDSRNASNAYFVARGKYFAEIKRRVGLPAGPRGFMAATPERPGWEAWCRMNGISSSQARMRIAAASGNFKPIEKQRETVREIRRNRNLPSGRLAQIRKLWADLTPADREEFIRWALSWKDYAPSNKSSAERPDIRPDNGRQMPAQTAHGVTRSQVMSMS